MSQSGPGGAQRYDSGMSPAPRRSTRARAIALTLFAAVGALSAGCAAPAVPTTGAGLAVVNVPADAPTLGAALKAVAPGGMILVGPGVYPEQLIVNKRDVTVRGVDRNRTIIDGDGVRPYGIVAVVDGVRVENLTVRNTTFFGVLVTGLSDSNGPSAHAAEGYEPFDPAKYPPVQRFAINYVTAYNNGLYGIYAFDSRHGQITHSYASGSADSGFYVGQCPDCDILVSDNVAERNAVGFENANASTSLSIIHNRFSNNRVGLTLISNYQEAFTPQHANLVAGNVLNDNMSADSPEQETGGFGVGLGISGGLNNTVTKNLIQGNARAGVLLTNTEDLPAGGNQFLANAFAKNGVDVANVSAPRAPATSNCPAPGDVPAAITTLPLDLFASCASGATSAQPAADAATLPGPTAPPGISFLKVPTPLDQPQMPDVMVSPSALPTAITHPRAADVIVPAADLFLSLTRPS